MAYKLRILPRANQVIDDALSYYAQFSDAAMLKFDSELETAYQSLELNPFFQFRYKNIRALTFTSLPYLVFFEVDEQEKLVFIYSVFNTYQDTTKYPK